LATERTKILARAPFLNRLTSSKFYESLFWEVTVSVTVKKKKSYMNICLILNGYRDRAVSICSISKPNAIRFMFVGLDEEQSLQKRGGYLIQIALSHYGCCCLHNETWISTQMNNMQSLYTMCKVHWGWQWDFQTFIVNCNKSVISV
jgi:hypothetical protein